MKKLLAFILVLSMVFAVAAVSAVAEEKKVYNVAYLVNGNLGDKSFFDSAHSGIVELVKAGRINCETLLPNSS
ncbi:MAG: hypothetical protein IKE81_12080 [Clostridia bacterium]|nr:hypothetical protein [Clostridia bacterium]